mmetsp:Transcript_7796/g.21370  ORF Transcript_7796/g.21370 Transcript_7796/m.21370 type:complete len:176 (-) Transcript_7796:124-651(-)
MTKLACPQVEPKKAASLYSKTDLVKAITEWCTDALPLAGYEELHFWGNIRILLGFIGVSFGLYGQFGVKFPRDIVGLALCVVGYWITSGLMTLLDFFIMKSSVIRVKVGNETVFVDALIPSFSSDLTLTVRTLSKSASFKTEVGRYFDSDGYLRGEALFADIVKLEKELFSKKTQ